MTNEWKPETNVHNELLDRLPAEILETFTPEQRAALWGAAKSSTWRRHPIDIRLSIPVVGVHLFIAIIGGVERRSLARRRRDARIHPFFTATNLIFLVAMFAVAVALGAVLTDVLKWLTDELNFSIPAATGIVLPK